MNAVSIGSLVEASVDHARLVNGIAAAGQSLRPRS